MDVASKVLLVVHGVTATVLAGAAVHNGVLAIRRWRRGRPVHPRLERLYPKVLSVAYLTTLILGLVIYPAYRLHVRLAFLDATVPGATASFEVKEHLAALGLILLPYLIVASRDAASPRSRRGELLYGLASVALALVVVYGAIVGLASAAIRPV